MKSRRVGLFVSVYSSAQVAHGFQAHLSHEGVATNFQLVRKNGLGDPYTSVHTTLCAQSFGPDEADEVRAFKGKGSKSRKSLGNSTSDEPTSGRLGAIPLWGRRRQSKERRDDLTRMEAVSISSMEDGYDSRQTIAKRLLALLPGVSFGPRQNKDLISATIAQLETVELYHEDEVAKKAASPAVAVSTVEERQFRNRMDAALTTYIETMLLTKLKKWSTHTSNLAVSADIVSSQWFKHFVRTRGTQLSSHLIHMTFDRLAFHNLKISGGGTIDAHGLTLDLLSTILSGREQQQQQQQQQDVNKTTSSGGRKRFPSSFEFQATDVILTQADIQTSSCIRNGLQTLFNRILKHTNISILKSAKVVVKEVDVLSCGRLACRCEAILPSGHKTPLEIRAGMAVTGQGHVLTFPNLEISLNPALGIFIPVLPEIHLDLGHDAQLSNLKLEGHRRQLKLDARVRITPDTERKRLPPKYKQNSDSFLAHYTCDVGRFVTNLGNFSR